MGIEFLENFEELELELQFLLNFSHEWELEWESPWFLDQLLISVPSITNTNPITRINPRPLRTRQKPDRFQAGK